MSAPTAAERARFFGGQLPMVLDFGPIDRVKATLGAAFWRSSFDAIVRATERAFDVPRDDLLGASRKVEIVEARFALAWATRQLTPWSLPTIGERLGGRDHTTVHHAVKQAERLRKSSARFRLLTDAMIETLVAAAEDHFRASALLRVSDRPVSAAPQEEAADAR